MKTNYFTKKNIKNQSKKFLSEIKKYDRHQDIQLENPVLFILDMQEYFLRNDSHAFVPSSKAIVPKILELIRAFTKENLPIVFTKHINTSENSKNMSFWWRDTLTKENALSILSPQFDTSNSIVIEKSQYDAFFETNLNQVLSDRKVTDIVITGVMTHLCCETTARSAFMHGYRVWFPVDGSATYNEDFHLSSLRNLAHGFANIVLVEDILKHFERR